MRPFTQFPNDILEGIKDLSHPELLLLCVLVRQTLGFGRDWAAVPESRLLQMTGLCRSVYYKAKGGLVERQLLEIDKGERGECLYRIPEGPSERTPVPTPDPPKAPKPKPSVPADPVRAYGRSANTDPVRQDRRDPVRADGLSGSVATDGLYNKQSSKENLLKKTSSTTEFCYSCDADDDFFEEQFFEDTTPPAASPSSNPMPRRGDGGERVPGPRPARSQASQPDWGLVSRLKSFGVSSHIAEALTIEHGQAACEKALRNVATRKPNNPAGWLVEEIRRGGYEPAKAGPDQLRLVTSQLRQNQNLTAEQAREAEDERGRTDWTAKWNAMSPSERLELERRTREHLGRLNPKMATMPLDFPLFRAAMRDLHAQMEAQVAS